jgi:hypothetical protein
LRSESEANVKLFSAKRSEFCEKCENLKENFVSSNYVPNVPNVPNVPKVPNVPNVPNVPMALEHNCYCF